MQRYGPPRLIDTERIVVAVNRDEARICTSHVERGNWTLRGHLRRFNGFSRKKANLRAALALYFAYYNFCLLPDALEHPDDTGDEGRDRAPALDDG